jgi:hypothetical protein
MIVILIYHRKKPMHLAQVLHYNIDLCRLLLQLIYDRQSVGQSVLESGAHLEPVTNFSFSLEFPLDS